MRPETVYRFKVPRWMKGMCGEIVKLLKMQLPIGRYIPRNSASAHHVFRPIAGAILRHVPQPIKQRSGGIVKGDEQEPMPAFQAKQQQAQRRVLQAIIFLDHRRRGQRAVSSIGPRMVRASEASTVALTQGDSHVPMPAGVVEGSDRPIDVTNNDNRHAGYLMGEEVTID